MKVAVIGGRDFKDYELVKKTLSKLTITVIVSGGALGADLLAERYADENNIPKKIFLPDWKTYGKIAGF
jgi:predicted Rossmann fold nucleotide-binding protein DprA/Smf involved in DNA uptake